MGSSDLPAGLTLDETRTYITAMLDAIRKAEQAAALHKTRYMTLGRRYGLSCAEIAEYLGMSESGVRQAILRAEASIGEDDQVLGGAA
ncbi:sigma factor-like helix-turn-helix DNA-binding protein [Nocardia sp. NPDC059239]|uniref:sigma factor-like helix-turn-helix DNA-binding protein n=1 Tax=unclassified Nocardia TaxID=2637762 RepID=UPI0036A806C9